MQRFAQNLSLALAVVGLTLVSSVAWAHGGVGGGHVGGSGARSVGGFAHSPTVRGVTAIQPRTSFQTFARTSNPPGTPNLPILPPRHPWPPYHMHYPVRFWFGGSYAVADEYVEGGIDVAFTSIRQLDAGDPSQNLAPAYRVWFHNNTDVDIDQAFDVAILASNDPTLTTNLPYAAVRVNGMGAGETMSVDIRLPIEAMSMATVNGQPAPYTYLHTIVDSQNELVEINKANNVSVYPRQNIPMLGN